MKAAIEAAIKNGAPRGSMELAKLAFDYEKHRQSCESIAKLLRMMLEFSEFDVQPDTEIMAVAIAELARWEAQQ